MTWPFLLGPFSFYFDLSPLSDLVRSGVPVPVLIIEWIFDRLVGYTLGK